MKKGVTPINFVRSENKVGSLPDNMKRSIYSGGEECKCEI